MRTRLERYFMEKSVSKLKNMAFVLIGLSLLYAAFTSFQTTKALLSEAIFTQGIVIGLEEFFSRDGLTSTFSPIIEFELPDGQVRQLIPSNSSNPPAYRRGEIVKVMYPSNSPEAATVNSFLTLWLETIIFSLFGLICLYVGSTPILRPDKSMK
jgi:hypothetical protein